MDGTDDGKTKSWIWVLLCLSSNARAEILRQMFRNADSRTRVRVYGVSFMPPNAPVVLFPSRSLSSVVFGLTYRRYDHPERQWYCDCF